MHRWIIAAAVLAGTASAQPVAPPANPPATPPAATTPAAPRTIPTAELARQPLFSRPQLSPDGKRMIARFSVAGKERIGIHSFDGLPMRMLTIPAKNDLRWYRWAGNDRILISVAKTVPYFDDEAVMTRLISFDLRTGQSLLIGGKTEGLEGDDVLYVDPLGEWILLSFQQTVYDYPSVSRVSLADNKISQVVREQSPVWEWYADPDGVVRIGIGSDETGWSMYYRSNATDKFRKIGKARYDDEDAAYDILRVAAGTDDGYILSNKKTGRYALYKFNYATKQLGDLVYESLTNDIDDYDLTEDGKALRGLWYADERDRVVWFDPALKKHQSDLDGAVKDREAWIVSMARDQSAMLVWTGSSRDPGSYYMYRPASGAMNRIAKVNDQLRAPELAPSRYVTYKARDGLEIPAYLTLPLGRPAKSLPLIVMPHGGPYGVRDKSDYDPEVQLLANRGYAVLQPNYRGSQGYGKSFYEKGEGQWGRAMQDDLDDGMDWLVKEGIADAKRVCIVGASYGGYAALWGATRNPERYRCAASFAGVSDVGRQLKYQLDFGISRRYRKDWRNKVRGGDKFDLKTVSPLYMADRLSVPVLLAHGDADQTVPLRQSKLYADALTKAGKSFEYHVYADEGHGFSSEANLKDWLDRLEAFLKKYNPA